MHLLREKVDNVVHLVNSFTVFRVSVTPLWEQLFTKKEDQVLDIYVLSNLHVFGRIENTHLDLVKDRSKH